MSTTNTSSTIAIIGAGLSGLTLALALHQAGISTHVYESRAAPLNIGGAIMLSPNALRILDSLSLYEPLAARGYPFELLDYIDVPTGRTTETYEFGSVAKYGYQGMRVYRYELIDILMDAIKRAGIPVTWGKKFKSVLEESKDRVRWEFADGSKATADLLVGADGIHSTVRKYLYPDLQPKWTGMAGINATVPAAQLGEKLARPVTYMHPQHGAFVMAPQGKEGDQVFIGKQRRIEKELSREEWDAIRADKEGLRKFLQEGNEVWPQVVRNAASDMPEDAFNVWPFYVIPPLPSWASEKRRVLILGDAAHAIPPSAGQGINQAFEDLWMLTLLLGEVQKEVEGKGPDRDDVFREALSFWQAYRQERVHKVMELNKQIDLRRMPKGMVEGEKEDIELSWLYNADFEGAVKAWAEESNKGADLKEMAKKVAKRECPVDKILKAFGRQ